MRRWTVVLISPQESGNVGAAARVLKNFGAGALRLVAPRCEVVCADSRRFASGATEVLRRACIYETLNEALADQQLTIGLTGVGGRHHRMDCVGLVPTALLDAKNHLERCALVFGREELGMTSEDLEACDFLWSLPTNPAFPSLNLAQSIAVALAGVGEAERHHGLAELGIGIMPTARSLNPLTGVVRDPVEQPATHEDMQLLGRHLSELMHRIGWREQRRAAESLNTLRNLFARGGVTRREVALLHGLCKQTGLALDRPELFRED